MSTGTCIIEIDYTVIGTVVDKNTAGNNAVCTIPQDSASLIRFIVNEAAIGDLTIATKVDRTAIIGTVIDKTAVYNFTT